MLWPWNDFAVELLDDAIIRVDLLMRDGLWWCSLSLTKLRATTSTTMPPTVLVTGGVFPSRAESAGND